MEADKFKDPFAQGQWVAWLRTFAVGEAQVKKDVPKDVVASIRVCISQLRDKGLYFRTQTAKDGDLLVERLSYSEWAGQTRRRSFLG